MNLEEARRAVIRRDEDVVWMRMMQLFQRETGELIRRQQRRLAEERKAHEDAIREATYDYEEAMAEQQRAEANRLQEERRQNRLNRDAMRRADLNQQKKRKRKITEEERARAVALEEAAKRQEQKIRSQKEAEERKRRETENEYLRNRSEYARKHAKTPAPAVASSPSNNGDDTNDNDDRSVDATQTQRSQTPSYRRQRKIETEDDIQRKAKEAQMDERQRLEIKRLTNLLAQREMEAQRIAERQEEERMLQEKEERRAAEIAEKAILEEQAHLATLARLQRQARKREKKILVPITNTRGTSSSELEEQRYVAVSPESAASPTSLKASADFDREKRERMLQAEKERIAERKKHDALIAEKLEANLRAVRKKQRERLEIRDKEYENNLREAEKVAFAEADEHRRYVASIKEREKAALKNLEQGKAKRQKQILLNALQMKLESQELAQQVQESNQAAIKAARDEQERLMANRKKAKELLALKEYHDAQHQDHLQTVEQKRRAEAYKQVNEAKKNDIMEKDRLQFVTAVDRQKYLERQRLQKQKQLELNEAFYDEKSKSMKKKEGVPRQPPQASTPAELPPHPEIAEIKEHNEMFLREVENQLLGVDGKHKNLSKTRL